MLFALRTKIFFEEKFRIYRRQYFEKKDIISTSHGNIFSSSLSESIKEVTNLSTEILS